MASGDIIGDIIIEGLPMDEKIVHPSISELWFNTHHDFNTSNPDAPVNKGYFNLVEEAKDFIKSLRSLRVRQAQNLTPEMLITDFLPKI